MQLLRNFKSFDFGEATFRYYGTYGPVNGLVIQLVQLFEGDCIVKIDEQDYKMHLNSIESIKNSIWKKLNN